MERRAIPQTCIDLLERFLRWRSDLLLGRNMNHFGGGADVADPRAFPTFYLSLRRTGTHIPCHAVWRQEKRIGVAFDFLERSRSIRDWHSSDLGRMRDFSP